MRPVFAVCAALVSQVVCAGDVWTGFREHLKHAVPQVTAGQQRAKISVKSAQNVRQMGDEFVASGGVHVVVDDVELFGDKVTGNKSTEVFTVEGNGKLVRTEGTVQGDTITFDNKNKTFSFAHGQAKVEPNPTAENAEPVYVKAESGGGQGADFAFHDGEATSCPLPDPHYEIHAASSRVLPGKRIEFRNVRFGVLGHTIIGLPSLVVPLIDDGRRYLPEVGNSPDEGYYVKTLFTSPLPGESYVDYHVDLMSKLGVGLGAALNYRRGELGGVFSAYGLVGAQRSLVLTSQHDQRIGSGRFTLNATYQRDNYLNAPQSSLLNTIGQYVIPWAGGQTRLGLTRVSSATGSFEAVSENYSLADQRSIGIVTNSIDLSLGSTQTKTSGSDQISSKRLDVRYEANASLRSFDAQLLYERSLPVGSDSGFIPGSDRTPVLSVTSDARRLVGGSLAESLPFTTGLSYGEFGDPANARSVSRLGFDWAVRRNDRLLPAVRLNYGGRFQQAMYSDDTAQYVLAYDANLSTSLSKGSTLNVTYRRHTPFGFTPLGIDSTGRNDASSMDLTLDAGRGLTFAAATGYDILQSSRGQVPWQQVWLRSRYRPDERTDVSLSVNYDTFDQVWGTGRFDARFDAFGAAWGVSAAYDGSRAQWAGFQASIEGFRAGKVTASALVDFNGYTSRIEAQHYQVIYDLHCAEAVLELMNNQVGFRSGQTIAFFVRLKAFPTGSPFGIGTRGNAVGGGIGTGR